MKTIIFTFVISLLFFSGFTQSKLFPVPVKPRVITLEFDNSGQLINSIPSAIRENKILQFKIEQPDCEKSVFEKYKKRQDTVTINNNCVPIEFTDSHVPLWDKCFSYKIKLTILENDGTRRDTSITTLNKDSSAYEYTLKKTDVSVEYKIIKTNEDNIFIANQLKEKIDKYHPLSKYKNYLQKLEKTFNSYAMKVDGLLLKDILDTMEICNGCIKKNESVNCDVLNILQKKDIETNLCDINRLYTTVMTENKDWIEQWLWYTERKVKLNPFDVYDPSEDILENDRQINLLTEKLNLRKELSKKENSPNGIQTLAEVDSKISEVTDTLNIRLKLQQALKSQKDSYNEWLKSISQKSEILYKGILYSSDNDRIAWMHNYDAKRNFQQQNLSSTLPRWISEQDEVFVLTHNVDTAKISLKPVISSIPIKSKLEEQIMPIDMALSNALAGVKNTETTKSFFFKFAMSIEKMDKTKNGCEDKKQSYQISIDNFKIAKQNLKWLLEQTEPPLEIKLKDGKTPKYYTDLQIIDEPVLDISNLKVEYSLFVKGKEKEVSSSGYKKYKLVSFWPAVGIAYVTQPRNIAEFANGTFTNNTEIGQFEATIGVKWYPWKTNVAYDRSTRIAIANLDKSYNTDRGNNRLLNRLSLYVGLGVSQKILKSYFVGASWDVTPGLSIQGGTNIYFNKYYDLSNSVVEKVYERPTFNLHFGVTIDPGVVPFLLKFL